MTEWATSAEYVRRIPVERHKIIDSYRDDPSFALLREQIVFADLQLKNLPDVRAPYYDEAHGTIVHDPRNIISQWLYESPTLQVWAKDMKTSRALQPLYDPIATHLPGFFNENGEYTQGIEIDEAARVFFCGGLDAYAIRTRAGVVTNLIERYYDTRTGGNQRWTSLACGAADPIFKAYKNIHSDAVLHLVDIDETALGLARMKSKHDELIDEKHLLTMNRNLVRTMMAGDSLVDELGEESQDVVDMIGIFEYFKDNLAAKMLHNAYRLVKPGGLLLFANMSSTREQLDFNQRGVGWPGVVPRSVDELSCIVELADIDTSKLSYHAAEDPAVYFVGAIQK